MSIQAKKANQLNKLQNRLIKKFRQAETQEAKSQEIEEIDQSHFFESPLLSDKQPKTISVGKAQKLVKLQEQLKDEFINQQESVEREVKHQEKKYEPITKSIKEVVDEKAIIPVYPMALATSAPKPSRAILFEDEVEEEPSEYDYETSSSPMSLPGTPEKQSYRQNKLIKQLMDTKKINVGYMEVGISQEQMTNCTVFTTLMKTRR